MSYLFHNDSILALAWMFSEVNILQAGLPFQMRLLGVFHPEFQPITSDSVNAAQIRSTSLHTRISAGASG